MIQQIDEAKRLVEQAVLLIEGIDIETLRQQATVDSYREWMSELEVALSRFEPPLYCLLEEMADECEVQ